MNTNFLLVTLALLATFNLLLLLCLLLRKTSNASEQSLREELGAGRDEAARRGLELRKEVSGSLAKTVQTLSGTLVQLGNIQKQHLDRVTADVESMRANISEHLDKIRKVNEEKLEEMRRTVDEKLQGTLEKRLGESFKLVSERLDAVHKGLGEMQNLATGVGDLKNVLTNVKVRGTWAEYQLEAILTQVLTPEQFDRNVATKEGSAERVEFAIRLPGRGDEPEPLLGEELDATLQRHLGCGFLVLVKTS